MLVMYNNIISPPPFYVLLYNIVVPVMSVFQDVINRFADTPMIGLGMVVLVFGYLLSIFRMKYQGYPYR